MADRLIWRRYYARGKRHDPESYGAVWDPHNDNRGLARRGILTRALTRDALYEALMARRSFATTGVGLHIEFCCGGEPMGSFGIAVF